MAKVFDFSIFFGFFFPFHFFTFHYYLQQVYVSHFCFVFGIVFTIFHCFGDQHTTLTLRKMIVVKYVDVAHKSGGDKWVPLSSSNSKTLNDFHFNLLQNISVKRKEKTKIYSHWKDITAFVEHTIIIGKNKSQMAFPLFKCCKWVSKKEIYSQRMLITSASEWHSKCLK